MIDWTIQKARDTYNIVHWGNGYFNISPEGHVTVRPDPRVAGQVDLHALTHEFSAHGLTLPVLVRFSGNEIVSTLPSGDRKVASTARRSASSATLGREGASCSSTSFERSESRGPATGEPRNR